MSGIEELKNMLLTFRVSELQMLLGYAGQNKTGRKTELQARALDLLKNKSVPHLTQVHAKIRELYKSIQQGGSVVLAQSTPGVTSSIDMPPNPPPPGLPASIANQTMRAPPMTAFIPLTDQLRSRSSPFLSMAYSGYQPNKLLNMNNPSQPTPPQIPVYPEVRLKRLPFYDILGDLLKPSTLTINAAGREPTANFSFYLTPRQASDVSMNREVGPGTKNEYSVQIQMRFCALDTSCEQDDQFPPGIQVRVNGKPAQLPNVIQSNKQGVEAKRPPRPVNVSSLVKLCPSVCNNVSITWNHDFQRNWVVAIYLVRKLSSNDLLDRLKQKGVRHADYTTGLIKDKLNDSDNDIATTALRVSLTCPLGQMRMHTPCRASTCSHLQCFDGCIFLSMNEKRPTWTCPVCSKPALYDNLVIDGYFQNVLDSPLLGTSNEIQLNKDGSWSVHDESEESTAHSNSIKGESHAVDSPKNDQIEEIKDDDEEESEGAATHNGDAKLSHGDKADIVKDVVVVDLTTSDEEDNVPMETTAKTPIPPSGVSQAAAKLDHVYSDSTSSLSTAPRSSSSVIDVDSPSPSPPLTSYNLPTSGVVSPPSGYMGHMRLVPDNRYHPY